MCSSVGSFAFPIATIMAVEGNRGMLVRRKEAKSYGTRKLVEGVWKPEQDVLYQGDLRLFLRKKNNLCIAFDSNNSKELLTTVVTVY